MSIFLRNHQIRRFSSLNLNKLITNVDVCFGCSWGDEGKGKIVAQLAKEGDYDFVCRWAGGNNAGHTVYVNGGKYKTHLIPSGVFYGIKSVIGPGCVVNVNSFFEEIDYLKTNGFNTDLIKISPKTHVVDETHINEDKEHYGYQGTTSRGIAPCYRDKYGRVGKRVEYFDEFRDYIWDEKLYGNVLCEGAQGMWLDIDHGNYPYVTSSTTMPYGSCSLGFPPQLINKIYGACKIYDTRVGTDPDFSKYLMDDDELLNLAILGDEYGVSTGRLRKTNWLNIDKLIMAINMSGTTDLVISKVDVLEEYGIFKLYCDRSLYTFYSICAMKKFIEKKLKNKCLMLERILFSGDPETVRDLI